MGDVVQTTYLKMEALANATQMVMQTKRAPAAPQLTFAETVMRTAKGMEALTIVTVIQGKYGRSYVMVKLYMRAMK